MAVLASGQLAAEHQADAREAIAAGRAPAHLADAWSGRWRYGVSGSLVGFLDSLRGRRAVVALLADTSQAILLGHLDLTEEQLLSRWRVAVRP